jgi:Secretion system C-terminal sorting domain
MLLQMKNNRYNTQKYFLILIALVFSNFVKAQSISIENKKWELNKYYSFTPELKDSINVLFEKDKTINKINLSGYTAEFDQTTCSKYFKDDALVKNDETWSYSTNKDSITVGDGKFFIESITENDLTLSTSYYYFDLPDYKALATKEYYVFNNQSGTLSINQNKINKKHKIFPNPVEDKLFLTFDSSLRPTKVEIYGLDGRQLLSQAVKPDQETQEINVQEFLKGFYLLKIKDKNDKVIDSGKILKK